VFYYYYYIAYIAEVHGESTAIEDIIDRGGVLTVELEQCLRVNSNGSATNKNGLSCMCLPIWYRAEGKTTTYYTTVINERL